MTRSGLISRRTFFAVATMAFTPAPLVMTRSELFPTLYKIITRSSHHGLRPANMAAMRRSSTRLLSTSEATSSSLATGRPSDTLKVDPGRLVAGVTREQIDKDPAIFDFMKANYPDAFETEEESEEDLWADVREELGEKEWRYLAGTGLEEYKEKIVRLAEKMPFPRNIRPLYTYVRDSVKEEGSRRCQTLRARHMVPGIVNGDDGKGHNARIFVKTPKAVIQSELDMYYRNFDSRVYDLTVYENEEDMEGTLVRVTPRDIQRHPVNWENIYCTNFCRYHAGRPLKIPVEYINTEESPALKRGAFVIPVVKKIEVLVEDGADIPEFLEIECTGIPFRHKFRKEHITLPDGVRFSDRILARGKEYCIGVVFGGGRDSEEEEEGEEAAKEETKKDAKKDTKKDAKKK